MSRTSQPFSQPGSNPHKVSENGSRPATALEPLETVPEPPRASAAEHARTIVGGQSVGTLASLTEDGSPWASVVQYGLLDDGMPVLLLSTLALHGRNLQHDRRISLAVAGQVPEGHDPGDSGRVSLAGVADQPTGDDYDLAKQAFIAAVPPAKNYSSWDDFTLYVMRIAAVRWVGGFGRMASAQPSEYSSAEPDPVAASADYAVRHLNADHADALRTIAQAFTGHTDATAATALRADRYGLDLGVETPRGNVAARVGFGEPVAEPDGLRAAAVDLTKRSRDALGESVAAG